MSTREMRQVKIDRFDLIVWSIMAMLLAAIAAAAFASRLVGIRAEVHIPGDSDEIGMRGPVQIEFSQPMDQESVEAGFSIEPQVEGNYYWVGNSIRFVPELAFQPGETISIRLQAGSQGAERGVVKDELSQTFTVRQPWIVYLESVLNGKELARIPASGGEIERLTESDGRVFDFSLSPDGEGIVYSLVNEERGIDIWTMARDGSGVQMLVGCGVSRCSNPVWSPDGDQIAYNRADAGLGLNEPYSAPRVWLIDMESGANSRLFADMQKLGYGPSWSPDGSLLAYADGVNNSIVVVDLATGQAYSIVSQLGTSGTWSPDGQKMLYGDILREDTSYFEVIYQVNLETQDSVILYGNLPQDNQYSNPQWSPDGNWIALTTWPRDSVSDRELMLMSAGDVFGTVVANDLGYIYNNYTFRPDGQALVYQRLSLESGNVTPQVLMYDIGTGENSLLVANGSFPAWLP